MKYLNPKYSNEKFEEFKLQHKNSMNDKISKEEENTANNLFHKSKSSNMEDDSNNIKLALKENKGSPDLYKHKHQKYKIVISV